MHTGMFFNVIVDERLGLQHRLYHLRGPHRGKCARTHVCSSALENQEQNKFETSLQTLVLCLGQSRQGRGNRAAKLNRNKHTKTIT